MLSTFHTHTYLCKHAEGIPLHYVKQAEKEGCSALGFSDHCPYPQDDIWAFCRMGSSQLSLYRKLVNDAKTYAPFPVYFGFECEWEPRYAGWFKDTLIAKYGAEYLVLGSHWYPHNGTYEYVVDILDNRILRKYIDFTIDAMRSGLFAFLAHPDLFLAARTSIDADCIACGDALIDATNTFNVPIEINGYGLFKSKIRRDYGEDYRYPVRTFWERAAAKNARIICNSDAHDAHDVIMNAWKARDFASRFGITPIEKLDIHVVR